MASLHKQPLHLLDRASPLSPINSNFNSNPTINPGPTMSPSPSSSPGQENPRKRMTHTRPSKLNAQRPPTPNSDPLTRPAKRRMLNRNGDDDGNTMTNGTDVDELDDGSNDNDAEGEEDIVARTPSRSQERENVSETTAQTRDRDGRSATAQPGDNGVVYDPEQDERERRETKRKSRALEREIIDNRDEFLRQNNDGLSVTIRKANTIYGEVKQTPDATTDSRLMVNVSDIAYRKSAQLVLGDTASGIDVDEFVSKCITFMRQSQSITASQRRRQDNDEEDAAGLMLDWAYLGANACHPYNARPAVPGFLLGPLSVQKRVRAPIQRRARQRDNGRAEVRPENLDRADIAATENNTVQAICATIKKRLDQHCRQAESNLRAVLKEDTPPEEIERLFRKHRITTTGGPSLFDFVINPSSFGQTVENLFYVSFLIKEGDVGIVMDDHALPTVVLSTETVSEARQRGSTKHQAVLGIDYFVWEKLIKVLGIEEGIIANREVGERRVGQRGWYG